MISALHQTSARTDERAMGQNPAFPAQKPQGGRPSSLGDRMFLDAVIWRIKTGVSWRDLDPRYGNWKTVYNRFRDWSLKGIWPSLVKSMVLSKHEANSILDSTVVRDHQEAAGGKGGVKKRHRAVQGGFSTKKPRSCRFSRKSSRIDAYARKSSRFILRSSLCSSCKRGFFYCR